MIPMDSFPFVVRARRGQSWSFLFRCRSADERHAAAKNVAKFLLRADQRSFPTWLPRILWIS